MSIMAYASNMMRLTMCAAKEIPACRFFANNIDSQGEGGKHKEISWFRNDAHSRRWGEIGFQQGSDNRMYLIKQT